MADKIAWACPKCGATIDEHGRGECEVRHIDRCGGFICECEGDQDESHGDSQENPCSHAYCNHCGWGGRFPPKPKIIRRKIKARMWLNGGPITLLVCGHWIDEDPVPGSSTMDCSRCKKALK